MTRARDWMKRIDEKVLAAKHEYQMARAAYLALHGRGPWQEKFKELRDEDVRGINERALSVQERQERRAAREAAGLEDDEIAAEIRIDGIECSVHILPGTNDMGDPLPNQLCVAAANVAKIYSTFIFSHFSSSAYHFSV